MTRQEHLALFRGTFGNPENAAICEPCTVAVLDAAGVPAPSP